MASLRKAGLTCGGLGGPPTVPLALNPDELVSCPTTIAGASESPTTSSITWFLPPILKKKLPTHDTYGSVQG